MPTVTLGHGGGGKAMKDLIDDVFVARLRQPAAGAAGGPGPARARRARRRPATGWPSRPIPIVVDPLFFPGGDIGKLAVCGTVNDLAVGGAVPLYLSCARDHRGGPAGRTAAPRSRHRWRGGARGRRRDRHRRHQGRATRRLRQAVHQHHRHRRDPRRASSSAPSRARPGDAVLVNGMLGDHGAAILVRARRPGARQRHRERLRRRCTA